MQSLPTINNHTIGAEKVKTINARDLWKYLDVKKEFANWIKKQIDSLGLEDNIDYSSFALKVKREKGASVKKEYILTLDAAKHIAMASRTAKGKEARNYFIEVEKAFNRHISPNVIGGYKSQLSQRKNQIEELRQQIDYLEAQHPICVIEEIPTKSTYNIDELLTELEIKMNDQLKMILNSAMLNAKANFRGSLETNIMQIKRELLNK